MYNSHVKPKESSRYRTITPKLDHKWLKAKSRKWVLFCAMFFFVSLLSSPFVACSGEPLQPSEEKSIEFGASDGGKEASPESSSTESNRQEPSPEKQEIAQETESEKPTPTDGGLSESTRE